MFDRLKGVARRVRRRVDGPEPVGTGFGPAQDAAFAALSDEADAGFQLVGAAVVSTWEVMLTDVGRALVGRVPEAERAVLVERMSDALVPTQAPVQQTGRKFQHAVKTGTRKALETGRLDTAVGPLVRLLGELPAEQETGWVKTVGYLAPLFAVLDEGPAVQARLEAGGPALGRMLAGEAQAFEQAVGALPAATELKPALVGALAAWHRGVARGFEEGLYAQRTALVEAVEALPRTAG